jgi:hypothetical protein
VTCSFHVDKNDPFTDTTWNAPATVDDIRKVFKVGGLIFLIVLREANQYPPGLLLSHPINH